MPGRQYGWACLGLTDTFDGPSPAWQFSWPSALIPSGDSSVAQASIRQCGQNRLQALP